MQQRLFWCETRIQSKFYNLVCNHLAISLFYDVEVALGLVLTVRLGVDEGALDGGVQLLLLFSPLAILLTN
jgi:hypothetical protein